MTKTIEKGFPTFTLGTPTATETLAANVIALRPSLATWVGSNLLNTVFAEGDDLAEGK